MRPAERGEEIPRAGKDTGEAGMFSLELKMLSWHLVATFSQQSVREVWCDALGTLATQEQMETMERVQIRRGRGALDKG